MRDRVDRMVDYLDELVSLKFEDMMKRILLSVVALVAAGMNLAPARVGAHAASGKFPVTVVDDRGRHVHLAHQPKHIISLFADYTEMLFALGLEKRIIGDGSKFAELATGIVDATGKARDFKYPSEWPSRLGRNYPIRAPKITHVEGGFASQPFDLETIESLQPDLIVAPYYKSQQSVYAKLHDLGLTVLFLNPSTVSGVMKDIKLVATATGTTKAANSVLSAMRSQLAGVKSRVAHLKSMPEVYYEIDASNPSQPYTAGPGTIPDEAIHLVHARNVADSVTSCDATDCYPAFSPETIIQTNPSVIVLADGAYGITPDSVKSRSGWSTISAVRSNRIYVINPDLLSRFGPRVVVGIRALARLVHPNAFKKT